MRRDWLAAAAVALTLPLAAPASAQLSLGISVRLAPPPLPVYAQPALPGPDYLWTPGYWAWDNDVQAYFWVPGTWVRAPRPGLLWTPPWWGWSDGLYVFHGGYWGPHIGFYGGVPYGFGYTGFGYQGGYWNGGHVFYNRTVNNISNVNVTNVYQRNAAVNRVTRVSYNGGPGGVQAQPTDQEQQAAREQHIAATGGQQAHVAAAHADRQAFAPANHGRPPTAATPRPLTAPADAQPVRRVAAQGAMADRPAPWADAGQHHAPPPPQGLPAGRPDDAPHAVHDRPAPAAPSHQHPAPHAGPHPQPPHHAPAPHPHPAAHPHEDHH